MEDQVREATNLGISAAQLGDATEELIRRGEYQLLGTAAKGQTAFRESFARLGELRSIVKPVKISLAACGGVWCIIRRGELWKGLGRAAPGTPVLALTASADLQSRAMVKGQFHLDSATTITVSPNQTNIRLGQRRVTTDSLDWVVREVKEKGLNMSLLIKYCRSLKIVGRVFCHLKAELGEDAWVAGEQEHKGENLIIGMFQSQTLPVNKSRVLSSFSGEGSCRVVVATTALGLGVNFPKVSHVIMYGVPNDVEAMLQQVGRAGRDGTQAHAVVYATKQHPKTDEAVRKVVQCHYPTMKCFKRFLHLIKVERLPQRTKS
ncbi:putative ATP-dependent RNA helicase R290 [Merluccius polli]|uniref:DNA 3'-5' helicase n=1 Tax=Merluccius polli TaxID=89951 RepID=A0AA47P1D7_MERPO|nr:putative ATP-dependent RNA helicase R290 [Merluccius polli]